MAAQSQQDVDKVTGTATTGHEWDGVRELNTPLPRWWLWIFYGTIIWSIGYWVVYPAWPLISSYSKGISGWQSREAIIQDLDTLRKSRGTMAEKIAASSLPAIVADTELSAFARAQGRTIFGDNCAACHGAGGGGGKGYPNLVDDEWLWGGKLADIEQTIRFGIRSAHERTRQGSMPAFGRDGLIKREDIENVADYVRSLSGLPTDKKDNLAAGKAVFTANCVICHGENGKGKRELGAPDLTDAIWLYGPDRSVIIEGLWNGRGGVMPAWSGRLDESAIKALAIYVYSMGGGEK